MKFQRDISSSQATLPIVCTVALALWFILPSHTSQDFLAPDYGIWQYMPTLFHSSQYTLPLGVLCAAIAVYMMVELKNKNLLLRVNSYMISSTLALLLALAAPTHHIQPGCLLMLFTLYAYFPLFASYQLPYPHIAFSIFFPLSLASLFFPKILLFVPLYWCFQIYLRAFSLRAFLASIIATLLPYWFYGGIAIVTHSLPQFLTHLQSVISIPDLFVTPLFSAECGGFSLPNILSSFLPFFLLAIIMTLIGIVDFQLHKLLDKTRTRSLYNVIQWHSAAIFIFILLYHQHATTILPLFLIDASILYGHFFTLTHTRFSHICNIVVVLLMVAIAILQGLTNYLL